MSKTQVRYIEASGANSQHVIQALLDEMEQQDYDLLQVVPNIDDRRGNPSVTAGLYLFFRSTASAK